MSAPQVTPADVEAVIAGEHYFTGDEGTLGALVDPMIRRGESVTLADVPDSHAPLMMLTFCVLVTRNGHTVTGEAYCADPAKFNAETGRIEARKVAINKLWPMVVYAERKRLAAGVTVNDAIKWNVIDRANKATQPPKGEWLVTADTDNGREVHVLMHEGGGKWLHEGEYTFQHGYYFCPIAWAPRPAVYDGPAPGDEA